MHLTQALFDSVNVFPTPTPSNAQATYFKGNVIEVALPKQMILEVVETDPGEKGNTAQGATKVTINRRAQIVVRGTQFIIRRAQIIVRTTQRSFGENKISFGERKSSFR